MKGDFEYKIKLREWSSIGLSYQWPLTTNTLFTLAPWPWPSEVLFTLGELYPRQTGQPREDCLGEDLGEGQV